MTRYIVTPDGSGWQVKKGNGKVVSNHRLKRRAKQKARKLAGPGDTVRIKDRKGKFNR